MKKPAKRFWEIDFLRGAAVVMMVVFHFVYDLNYFGAYAFSTGSGFWWLFARATASIFILLAGISLTISHANAKREKTPGQIAAKYLKRGLWIFSLGILITLATWIYLPRGFIVFGILHFIGISIILAIPLLEYKKLYPALALPVILAGIYLQGLAFDFSWLVFLGFMPSGFYSIDYFPIFPWFGLFLAGMFLGKTLYPDAKRAAKTRGKKPGLAEPLCFLGRHSLLFYFIHQPVLIVFLHFFVL